MHHFLVVGVQLQQEAGVEGAVGRGGQWAMGLGNDSRAQPLHCSSRCCCIAGAVRAHANR
eukprot:scaffold76168_cov18-Tisochrysis_lutea.AAC.1